jgi:hypothetical protein
LPRLSLRCAVAGEHSLFGGPEADSLANGVREVLKNLSVLYEDGLDAIQALLESGKALRSISLELGQSLDKNYLGLD